jgi:hypothetical protein
LVIAKSDHEQVFVKLEFALPVQVFALLVQV